jgi:DNA-binding response OmpR family regulator
MSRTSPTVLVLEDEIDILSHLQEILEEKGYHVLTATDGQTGYHRAMEYHPDLILMDMMMPRLSGIAVTERLRERKLKTPIVMMTANDSDQQRSLAMFVGVSEYVAKPFSAQQILDVIERFCPARSLAGSRTRSRNADSLSRRNLSESGSRGCPRHPRFFRFSSSPDVDQIV